METHSQNENSKELRYQVVKLYADMYLGSGKDNPSITTRLTMLEDKVGVMSKHIEKLGWIVLVSALAVLGDIAKELILKGMK